MNQYHLTLYYSFLCLVDRHMDESPTLELLEEVYKRNLSMRQQAAMGVVAHEVGHLLGAPEVRLAGVWVWWPMRWAISWVHQR
jgi:hypothetical protein